MWSAFRNIWTVNSMVGRIRTRGTLAPHPLLWMHWKCCKRWNRPSGEEKEKEDEEERQKDLLLYRFLDGSLPSAFSSLTLLLTLFSIFYNWQHLYVSLADKQIADEIKRMKEGAAGLLDGEGALHTRLGPVEMMYATLLPDMKIYVVWIHLFKASVLFTPKPLDCLLLFIWPFDKHSINLHTPGWNFI